MRLFFFRINLLTLICLLSTFPLQAMLQIVDTTLILQEVVVTGSRNERPISRTPGQIQTITPWLLKNSPGQSIDEILGIVSGVNAIRFNGLGDMQSQVGIRGLTGNEQGRTLVLLDGVPINTSDEGSVNWNSLSLLPIQRIEVLKGPGSSLYGNNAMGGVIHLLTQKPDSSFACQAKGTYGSLQTWKGMLRFSGGLKRTWGWMFGGYYQQSDGYNPIPKQLRTQPDYTLPCFIKEGGISAKLLWNPTPLFQLDVAADFYKDKRGEGEKIRAKNGMFRCFDHSRFQVRVHGEDGAFSYQVVSYFQRQNYFRLDERLKDDAYQRFDVRTKRDDGGIMGLVRFAKNRSDLTIGGEFKNGSVDGGDYYVTSSDQVLNQGTMTFISCFIQEELDFWRKRFWLQLALRYDRAFFYRGKFEAIGDQVADFNRYNGNLKNNRWEHLSPKVALRFNPSMQLSFYVSYAHGFRASILDDLCRSGWMWVGPKVANPELIPERLKQYELGGNWMISSRWSIASAVYYARGDDFLYYVATGEKMWGKREIYRRENVSRVELKGVELDVNYFPITGLKCHVNYTYNLPKVRAFQKQPELVGNQLTYSPKVQWKGYLIWTKNMIDVMLKGCYKSKQYTTEGNDSALPGFATWDCQLSCRFFQNQFILQAEILNLFDRRYMNTEQHISIGRVINLKWTLNINKL